MATDTPPSVHLLPVQHLDAGEHTEIIIRPISDVHIGNPSLDEKFLLETIREIRETPNMYWCGVGDYIESNLKRQKHAGVYHDLLTPREQCAEFVRLFGPVAHKCLGLIGGNHDHRVLHDTSFDPAWMIAEGLGVADKYRDDGLIVRLTVGKRTRRNGGRRPESGGAPCRYILYLTHGTTGSALVSGKALSLQRAGDVCLADVIVGAHVHSEVVFKDRVFTPTFNDIHDCAFRDRWFVNSGAFVAYGAYARTARMRPQAVGCPKIHLETRRERVAVTV